jgi:hypothetical protein
MHKTTCITVSKEVKKCTFTINKEVILNRALELLLSFSCVALFYVRKAIDNSESTVDRRTNSTSE